MAVLIIEDNLHIIELLEDNLIPTVEKILIASTGEQALALLQKKSPDFLIIDYFLPDMNGSEFLHRAIAENLHLPPFIVITDKGDERIAVQVMKLGARDYIRIDNNFAEMILPIVRNLIGEIQTSPKLQPAKDVVLPAGIEWQVTLDASADATCITDKDLKIFKCNAALEKLVGLPSSQILHHHVDDILLQKFSNLSNDGFKHIVTYLTRQTFETQCANSWCQFTIDPILTHQNTFDGAVYTICDITDRKIVQEAMQRERDLAEQYLDIAGVIMVVLDSHANIVRLNRKGRQVLGCTLEEVLGKNWFEMFRDPKEFDRLDQYFAKLMSGKIELMQATENIVLTKSGETLSIRWHNTLLYSENGAIIGMLSSGEDVTNKLQAQQKLVQSEESFRMIFNLSASGIALILPDGKFMQVNEQFAEIVGYSQDELLHKTITGITYKEDKRLHMDYWQQVLDNEINKFDLVKRLVHKNGSIIWVHEYSSVSRHDQHKIEYIIAAFVDITAQKLADEALKISEERFKLAMQATSDGLYDWDLQTGKIYYSVNWKKMLGYEADELATDFSVWENLTDPKGVAATMKVLQDVLDGKKKRFEMEFKMKHKDGHWVDILSRATAEFKNGKAVRVIGTHVDISPLKRAEEALRARNEFIQTILDNLPIGIAINDTTDGNATYLNKKFEEIYGWSAKQILDVGSFFMHVYPEKEYRERLMQRILNDIASGDPNRMHWESIKITREDGSIGYVDAVNIPLVKQNVMISTVIDVTERKNTERALMDSEEKFRTIFENAPIMIQSYDQDGKCLLWNQECQRVLGWTKEEAHQEKSLLRIMYPSSFERNTVIQSIEHADGKFREFKASTKDGKTCYQLFADFRLPDGFHIGVGYDITERKEYEQQLIKSEEKYRNLVELSPDGVVTLSKSGVILSVNEAFLKFAGYPADAFIGKHFMSIPTIVPQEISFYTKMVAEIFQGRKLKTAEFKWRHKDGSLHIGEAKVRFLKEKHRTIGLLGVLRDITERKEQEFAIQESERKYRQLVEQSNDAIYLIYENKFEMVNPRFVKIFGYTEQEVYQEDFDYNKLVHPSSLAFWQDRIQRLQHHEKVSSVFEFTALHKNGSTIDCEVNISLITYKAGTAIQGILRDISERKIREMELRKLSQAVAQSASSVVICDLAGKIEYVNEKYLKLTGYTIQEVIGKTPAILKTKETPRQVYKELWDTILAGNVWHGRLHNKKKNGELFWEQVSISPLFNDEGEITHFLGIKEDITERIKLEEQFRQAQKMEAVGKLAGGVAHDFNNLLTVINGYTAMLIEDRQFVDDDMEKLEEINKCGQRAAALTRQLLAFSRKQIMKPEVLDINELLQNMEKMLSRLIGEDIDMSINYNIHLNPVLADPGQIEQIILNIIVNARDAMPQGGRISIATQQVFLDNQYLKMGGDLKPGNFALISITDNGVGMSREIQEHIFEPFFTTKAKDKGTGLGLSTVYGIVKQSGGDIRVYSELNHGTTFKVYLPTIAQMKKSIREEEPTTLQGGSETILVAEDEESLRKLVQNTLHTLGYKTIVAPDGVEALKLVKQFDGKIDLLLCDVVMPNMSGNDLARKILELYPDIKICYMSGYTDDAIVHFGVLEAGIHFLQKPFTRYNLAKTLRKILD